MKNDQYIIAIGASAGGMNQINKFFDYTPLDGVSYIVIQHLSADYKSMMASLLDKHSKLHIEEAKNNMLVETNRVYLIPSKNCMTIKDGRLLLTDKLKGVNLTINTFFKSLAEERGNKAIGIILSGTGRDGTEGMKAIKAAGGMLMASSPESAEFDSMPLSIIDTGLVNYALPPEEMPEIIKQYVQVKTKEDAAEMDDDAEEKTMHAITGLIKDKLPEDFTGYKKSTVLRRIKRRASLHNLNNLNSYLNLLKRDPNELQSLAKDFLISVTSFFRDKEAFGFIDNAIIPRLIEAKPDEEIKIWVAGCATGEEAYSFAIMLREHLDAANKKNIVKIFASDIDSDALQFAGKGCYGKDIEKSVSAERLKKFFAKDGKGYKISKPIREMLIFAHHDLVKNPPYCNMNLISCRNLLIYMNPSLQKKVLGMLHFGLRYQGYLFLGPSENVADISSSVKEIDNKWKIYQNTETRRNFNLEAFVTPSAVNSKKALLPPNGKDKFLKKNADPALHDVELLKELGFSGVTVNEDKEVMTVFEDTQHFLLQKMFVHHLPDLLAKPLQIAFSAACLDADKNNKLIVVKGIKVKSNALSVSMYAAPLVKNEHGELKRLVLFSYDEMPVAGADAIVFDESFYANKYTVNLEEELTAGKEKLAATEDLLNASNENMQSFNEELLSANEEMQSTNEEMQSVNEELQTINAEYQLKINELSDLNDDLNNYFRSNINSQIFVNNDLMLIKFSPQSKSLINLLETDIGRPLSNLSTKSIRFETIDEDVKQVLLHGGIVTKEIQAMDGKWFQVITMPYLRNDNKQADGAIITFNDITELKNIQLELAKSNSRLKAINADLDNFVYTASHDLLAPINSIDQIVHLLKDQETEQETSQYIGMLLVSVQKFRNVIKEMTAIGNIESEMVNTELINLRQLIDEILASIQWKITSEKVDIKISLEVETITYSKKNCRSMIFNLINNAIKFKSPDRDPHVVITTKDLPDYTLLSVKDNGVGIKATSVESNFQMYKRLNNGEEG